MAIFPWPTELAVGLAFDATPHSAAIRPQVHRGPTGSPVSHAHVGPRRSCTVTTWPDGVLVAIAAISGLTCAYLPATAATKSATALAFAPCSRFAGMRFWPVPPTLIALSTRADVTVPILSRSGPVTPRALTASRL